MIRALVVVGLLASLQGAWPSAALAQDQIPSKCRASGPYVFTQVESVYGDLRPSQREELATLGVIALRTGCTPELTCVSALGTSEDRQNARLPCRIARQAMLINVVSRKRAAIRDLIKITVVNRSSAFNPGDVYVFLKPGVLDPDRLQP